MFRLLDLQILHEPLELPRDVLHCAPVLVVGLHVEADEVDGTEVEAEVEVTEISAGIGDRHLEPVPIFEIVSGMETEMLTRLKAAEAKEQVIQWLLTNIRYAWGDCTIQR